MLKLKDLQKEVADSYRMEGIDHQYNSTFGKELEEEFNNLLHDNYLKDKLDKLTKAKLLIDSEFVVSISTIIHKHTNMLVDVIWYMNYNMMAVLPSINKNNVLLRNRPGAYYYSQDDSLKYIKEHGIFDGIINLQTGRVSGDFSKIRIRLAVGLPMLVGPNCLSSAEAAALLIHEVGHLFTMMELVKRLSETNYIVEEGTRRLLTANTKEQRIVILSDIEDSLNVKLSDKEKLAIKVKSAEAYRVVILQTAITATNQQLNIKLYDLRSCEQLADQFCSRHGYSRQLALALDKLYHILDPYVYMNPVLYRLLSVLVFIYPIGPVLTILYLCGFAGVIYNPYAVIYDAPKIRILKLQQQINDALKNQNIPSDVKAQYVQDFYEIQKIIEHTHINDSIYTLILKYLVPEHKAMKPLIDIQEELEALHNNDLFTAGTELDISLK